MSRASLRRFLALRAGRSFRGYESNRTCLYCDGWLGHGVRYRTRDVYPVAAVGGRGRVWGAA